MSAHVIPMFALEKARKNGTAKLVQQTLLTVLKSGTPIQVTDEQNQTIATLNNEREFANWWNETFS